MNPITGQEDWRGTRTEASHVHITYSEPSGIFKSALEILFPPKLPTMHSRDWAISAEYYTRMGRTPKATHVVGGAATVIHVGTAQEKRIFALPGRVV